MKGYKFLVSIKFNGIPREGNTKIAIKYHKETCREHMLKSGMWDVFSLTYNHKQDKTWYRFINQYIFYLDYAKIYIKGPKRGPKADKYLV